MCSRRFRRWNGAAPRQPPVEEKTERDAARGVGPEEIHAGSGGGAVSIAGQPAAGRSGQPDARQTHPWLSLPVAFPPFLVSVLCVVEGVRAVLGRIGPARGGLRH